MPSLKDLKNRIASVKSTRKITSAMKMVAASKLRRAQDAAVAARPYGERMARMLASLSENLVITETTPRLLRGTGSDKVILLVVMTSDRGLCGAFNGSIVREARRLIRKLESEGKTVKLLCVGRKGRDLLRRDHASKIVYAAEAMGKKRISFADADSVTAKILELYDADEFDVCQLVFNRFKSAIAQIVTLKQLIPVSVIPGPGTRLSQQEQTGGQEQASDRNSESHLVSSRQDSKWDSGSNSQTLRASENSSGMTPAVYEFEPDEETILEQLLPRNLAMQVYGSLLESAAGEQGARMTAMDNATRNAGDMINRLTLNYNRSRQAYITKELIEIISGAEAV